MKSLSLRLRIAALSALISGLVLASFGAGAYYLLCRERLAAVDTEIRALGSRHPAWLANRSNFDRFNTSLEFIFGEERKDQVVLLVKDTKGQTLYRSPDWPRGLDPAGIDCTLADDPRSHEASGTNQGGLSRGGPPWASEGGQRRGGGRGFGLGRGGGGGGQVVFTKTPHFFTAAAAESTWRFGILGNDELRLVVGLNFDAVRAELTRMRNAFLLAFPVALLLVGGGGWLVAERALRPLRTIARTAEQVTARGLDQRIPASSEDPEIERLIQVLNGMMDRLDASFRQATRFSADASHELKTPLAVMQAELEQAIQNAAPGSDEQRTFGNLLEETQRLKRITGALLLLAQADSGRLKLAIEEFCLSDEVEGMVEDARILAADSRLEFNLGIQPGVLVQADRGLLRMAMLNLIQNAVRYNQPGGAVDLKLEAGREIVLTVCNTGPGIPAAERARVFDRFYRAKRSGQAAVEGLGLGLSLAREIVTAHGGRLQLKESQPGRTCFELALLREPPKY